MMDFNVELAGVPIRVRCRFEKNKIFLADYLTERKPVLEVEPSEEDLVRIRRGLEQMAAREGIDPCRVEYAKHFLENNAIHALIADRLVHYKAFLFHGSALCLDGEAYIFTAPSGTGKSTQAGLWRETFGDRVQMINDDKPLLKIENGSVMVYGSPWDGKHRLSRNTCAPLRAVFDVKRSDENRADRLSRADAFQIMMKQAYLSENGVTRMQSIALEKEVSEKVPFYRLYCNREPEAVRAAYLATTENYRKGESAKENKPE